MTQLLIVDDDRDIREFAANFFRKKNVIVKTAPSGEEAIQVISQDKPELVLLDIGLNGMDGIQTLKSIRQTNKDLKVIMVTGMKPEEQDALNQCYKLGILDYIHKPLELHKLEQVVMAILGK